MLLIDHGKEIFPRNIGVPECWNAFYGMEGCEEGKPSRPSQSSRFEFGMSGSVIWLRPFPFWQEEFISNDLLELKEGNIYDEGHLLSSSMIVLPRGNFYYFCVP